MNALWSVLELLATLRGAAPAEARLFGDAAWLVGLGCLAHVVHLLRADRRERVALAELHGRDPEAWVFAPRSAMEDALAGWLQEGHVVCALSPDAAWQHLTLRLQAFHEQRAALPRFLAYVPLMLGLAGTMIGLAHLLPELDRRPGAHTGGPPPIPMATGSRHLEGVFYGTLSGVGAALIGGVAGLRLARSSGRALGDAELFLRASVLPQIPKSHVKLDIEDAVLRLVGERAQTAVNAFRNALEPLSATLGQHARAATAAAERASAAFDQAAVAVKRAGNLERAAARLVSGIEAIDGAAGTLGGVIAGLDTSARQQAQIVDAARTGVVTLRGATLDLVNAVGTWQGAAAEALKRQEQHGELLTQETARLHVQILGVSTAFSGLADSVAQRNQVEGDKLRVAKDDLDQVVGVVQDGSKTTARIASELSGVREAMEGVTGALVRQVGDGLRQEVAALMTRIDGTLRELASEIPRGSAEAKAAGQALLRDLEEARRQTPTLTADVTRLHDEVAKLSQALRDILAHPGIVVGPASPGDNIASDALLAELRNVQAALAEVAHGLAHRRQAALVGPPPPAPAPAAPARMVRLRAWWRRARAWRPRRRGTAPS